MIGTGMNDAQLSLVIPSNRGGRALIDTIAAFAREDAALDIIVAESACDGSREAVQAQFPRVTVLHFDEARTLPELRAAGLLAARGAIVALTSDACTPAPGWAEAVRRAHRHRAAAIGGAVENGSTTRLVDWAVFFCEYGRYMLPLAPAQTSDLPGQNVSYKREALTGIRETLLSGVWEPFWHWELASRGAELRRDPSIIVMLRRHDTVSGFVRERFHYARSFAGQRLQGARWLRRAAYAAGAVLLPPVLLARMGSQLLPKRRALGRLACSVPYLVLFTCAWAAGECVGYVAGAGASAARVE
jgi:hypothetical protein